MDIKALRYSCGLALVLASAMTLSACGSSQTIPEEPEAEAFVPQTGSIETEAAKAEPQPISTQNIQLAADYPREYIVKKGDTLWDIASMFLQDPWYWPEIWQRNPQVENPHLIFPGDILHLAYVDGMPQITVTRPGQGQDQGTSETSDVIRKEMVDMSGKKVVKLTPRVHRQSLEDAIPSIPADAIRQFLIRPRVVNSEDWEAAPYIVGSDDAHLILGSNNKIYIRGELDKERIRYSVFREGKRLVDPDTDQLLGYEIIYAGQTRITRFDNPSTGILAKTTREVLLGDKLLPTDKGAIDQQYFPQLPPVDIEGKIISLFDAISSVAKYQIAVINRGSNDNLQVGHLLATYHFGGFARDRFLNTNNLPREQADSLEIQLPNERSGIMMLFKVFDKVSYGLILKSTRSIRKGDVVAKPR